MKLKRLPIYHAGAQDLRLALVCTVLFSMLPWCPGLCAASKRILEFPDAPVGRLQVIGAKGEVTGERLARSRMEIPPGEQVQLVVQPLVHISFLGRLGPDDLYGLSLVNCDELNDKSFVLVSKLKGLRVLYVSSTDIGDRSAAAISSLSNLVSLDVSGTSITGRGVKQFGALVELRKLDLSRNKLNDESLSCLSRLPQLKQLRIRNCHITDKILAYLAHTNQLEYIDLGDNHITDAGMRVLAAMPGHLTLRKLVISNCPISPGGLALLATFPKLEALSIAGLRIDENAIAALASIHALVKLDISGTQATGKTIAPLARLPKLKLLVISANSEQDALIRKSLAHCTIANAKNRQEAITNMIEAGSRAVHTYDTLAPRLEPQ